MLMKAIVIEGHGSLDKASYSSVAIPEAGPDEVLVAIKAAALNRLDLWVIEGWRGLNLDFPHVLGSDGAGIIEKVGEKVEGFSVGDRVAINPTYSCGQCYFCRLGVDNRCDSFAVFGEHVPGFYAEYQTVPVRNLLHIPDEFPFEQAAAASLVYVTAWHSLIEVGQFKAGQDILVIGAGGGVNGAYIDVARFAGARDIYVVGSTDKKLENARRRGANMTYNRNEVSWEKEVYLATGKMGVDVVVDNVGAATFRSSLRALKKGGRLLTVGNSSGSRIEIDNRYIFGKHLHIIGTTMGPKQDYRRVMDLVFRGKLSPAIDTIYPLKFGLDALRRLEKGNVNGKLVLRP